MNPTAGNLAHDLIAMVEARRGETYVGADVLQRYAEERIAHLKTIEHEKGYEEAVRAEASSMQLMIVGRVIDEADAADRQLWGLLEGLLTMAVRVLLVA